MNEKKWWSSSANADNISATLKGVAIAIIPALIFIGQMLGFSIAEAELTELVNSLAVLISSVLIVGGLTRKLYFKYRR